MGGFHRTLPFSFVRHFRYDVVQLMTTILLHTARAITPGAEIQDAGILIRDDVIEAVGPREGLSL